jgi:hypothetical protein
VKVYAKYLYPENGYPADQETAKKFLEKGKSYVVEDLSVGQSRSFVYLKDFMDEVFNSVNFDFFDEEGKEIDIYSMSEFNPYLSF